MNYANAGYMKELGPDKISVNFKDYRLTLLHSYLFGVSLEIMKFHLLHWSELNNCLMWRMRLRSAPGGKVNILTCFWLMTDSYSTQTYATTENSKIPIKFIWLTLWKTGFFVIALV